jgi:hypothetical protein
MSQKKKQGHCAPPALQIVDGSFSRAAFTGCTRLSALGDFAYEYEEGKLAIDVINGGPLLREWMDNACATPQDLDTLAIPDEQDWLREYFYY